MAVTDVTATAFVIMTNSLLAGTITLVVEIAFCSMTLVFTLQHVISGRVVDLNRIIGAICAYLLLGVTLGMANMLVALYVPGSFNGLSSATGATHSQDLIYYSFVTLSTLGYGDITPASPLARVLAYLTAVLGQFYIAILIGMLVGLYLSDHQAEKTKT
jgi:voltage-gated potassium channel